MFSRREKMLLVAAALAVAAVIGLQLVGSSRSRVGADEARASARWRALKKDVSSLEARLAAMTSPPSQAVPRLLRAGEASAASTGVTLASIRPRRPTKTALGSVEQGVEIQVTGRFPDVAKFMLDLQKKHPYVRLTRAAVTSADGASDNVNATVVIAAYSPGEVKKK